MSEPESAAEALRWLSYAREDLEIAGQMALASRSRYACWFSQQAAEKTLKAVLVMESIEFPYSHDLRRLRDLFPEGWPQGASPDLLDRLTEWGAEARYPGDWPEPTAADATRAESEARSIYDAVAAEFSRRGLTLE
ncbi:MAG: HEPN domain-containing protein [Dehalococcoidia bacterium]|nr:HEPN domain-containing protein [Dehalococcoidia bacterium]MYD29932.1 HEPN domain-containing protein [Dehalococcoidia bacterium]